MSYAEHLQEYFAANDIDAAAKQRVILLSSCGAEAYQLIRNLVVPHKPADKSFKHLVDLVQTNYCPPPSVIVQCFAFNNQAQRERETTAEFVMELQKLLGQCQFGASLDEMLCDRLVCAVKDGRLQQRLLAEPDLTFKKAFELCQTSEFAVKMQNSYRQGRSRA